MKSFLNLGCGSRFNADWTNVDFIRTDPAVIGCDLRKGIPFSDGSFDVVYHSHLLEHLPTTVVPIFLSECYRVLRPGGVLRMAIPDLERIARTYLHALERANAGEPGAHEDYDWIMLELFDQTVRERPGGEMAAYLQQPTVPNQDFVVARIGSEARNLIDAARAARNGRPRAAQSTRLNLRERARNAGVRLRERMLRTLLGSRYELLALGKFRRGGEIHLWMYDRFSAVRALRAAGFRDCSVFNASESHIPNWSSHNLDTEPDGTIYKPDSLYVEGVK